MTLQKIIFTVSQLKAIGSGLVGRDLAQQVLFSIFLINILGELANPACFVFIEWYIHRWYNKMVKRTFK